MNSILFPVFIVILGFLSVSAAPEEIKDCECCRNSTSKPKTYKQDGIVYDRCIQPGTIALTFNAGPHLPQTAQVLDVLHKENVTATFFVNGHNYWPDLETVSTQALVLRAVREGHQIGSYTWSHSSLPSLSADGIKLEMSKLSDKLTEILGEAPTIMRPPYGLFNDAIIDVVHAQLGYKLIMWSLYPCDWAWNHEESLAEYRKVMGNTDPATTPGFISIHHDPLEGGSKLIEQVIQYVKSIGYRFVSVNECLGFK